MRRAWVLLAAFALSIGSHAQESLHYRLTDHAFPAGGAALVGSDSLRVRLVAIGDAIAGPTMASVSYRIDASFGCSYPPAGEVRGLRFDDAETLIWNPERSIGSYNLYRGLLSAIAPGNYGLCEQYGVPGETTTDDAIPPAADAYFYLVTAVSRLDEEGTAGYDSSNAERATAELCP